MFCKETDFQDSPIGKIPRDWEIIKFGETCIYSKGKKPDKMEEEQVEGYIPYLSTQYLRENGPAKFAEYSKKVIMASKDDLILLWDGANAGEVFLGKRGVLSSTMVKITPKEKRYKTKFLFYLLKMNEHYLKGQTKGTGIPHVDGNVLDRLAIPIPQLSEQENIVGILDVVNSAICFADRVIAKTERLKKGLMQQLLSRGIGNTEYKDTPIGKIPKKWDFKPLEDVCTAIVDCPHTTPKFTAKGALVIRNFNIRDGELIFDPAYYTTEEELKIRTQRNVPQNDDVLFSREAPVGEASLAPKNTQFSLGQRTMLLRTDKRILSPLFLVYAFYSPIVRRKLRNLEAGVTAHHVNVADIRKLEIPLPPLAEQERIARIILTASDKLKLEKKEKTELERIKQGLMGLLLTGKIRIKGD